MVLLAGCSSEPVQGALEDPVVSPPPAPATPPAPVTSRPTSAPVAATTRYVYWLGAEDPRGPRLYREALRRPAADDPVRDAVEAMLGTSPRDPDYRSLWADGTALRGVRREGTTAVVDLSQEARRSGGGSAFEAATVQQLVHTVTAAEPALRAVRLLVEGEPVDTLWGSVDTSEPLVRAPAASTLAPVWLDLPDRAEVTGAFGGSATVFEATVSWQVRRGTTVVQEGFSTATIGAPARGDWTGELDVPPGDYDLWAYESSAEDGSITWLDTKRISVTG